MAFPRKKIKWTAPSGQADYGTSVNRGFHAPHPIKGVDASKPELDGRPAGGMFQVAKVVRDTYASYVLAPITVRNCPTRWLIPGQWWSGSPGEELVDAIGIHLGVERTEERSESQTNVIISRLRHAVVINGEKFFVLDGACLRFLD